MQKVEARPPRAGHLEKGQRLAVPGDGQVAEGGKCGGLRGDVGGKEGRNDIGARGPLQGKQARVLRAFFERHLFGDAKTLQPPAGFLPPARFHIEEQMVGEGEDPQVRLYLGLTVEEAGVAAEPRFEGLHVVAHQGVEEPHPVLAREHEPAPVGEVEEGAPRFHGLVGPRRKSFVQSSRADVSLPAVVPKSSEIMSSPLQKSASMTGIGRTPPGRLPIPHSP